MESNTNNNLSESVYQDMLREMAASTLVAIEVIPEQSVVNNYSLEFTNEQLVDFEAWRLARGIPLPKPIPSIDRRLTDLHEVCIICLSQANQWSGFNHIEVIKERTTIPHLMNRKVSKASCTHIMCDRCIKLLGLKCPVCRQKASHTVAVCYSCLKEDIHCGRFIYCRDCGAHICWDCSKKKHDCDVTLKQPKRVHINRQTNI